jgi:hypothetical protein
MREQNRKKTANNEWAILGSAFKMNATTKLSSAPPIPQKATGSHFYKYSEFTGEKREWLKNIILENRIYVPRLSQLNDPADGRPKLKGMSGDEWFDFLFQGSVLARTPQLSVEDQIKEGLILDYNIKHHGTDVMLRGTVRSLYEELDDWRIYCLCKRSNNMSMWAKYAGNHAGYCLEFAHTGLFFGAAKEVTYGDPVAVDIRVREQMDGRWFFCKTEEWSGEEEIRVLVPRRMPPEH